ncbi:MAG: hypothetical protein CM15mP45_12400 [Deltaproteobacteria bacterium]|nr:MAG: hypothetical protein CM15mP45_12400 [Deltaproteobacteria bacterium]
MVDVVPHQSESMRPWGYHPPVFKIKGERGLSSPFRSHGGKDTGSSLAQAPGEKTAARVRWSPRNATRPSTHPEGALYRGPRVSSPFHGDHLPGGMDVFEPLFHLLPGRVFLPRSNIIVEGDHQIETFQPFADNARCGIWAGPEGGPHSSAGLPASIRWESPGVGGMPKTPWGSSPSICRTPGRPSAPIRAPSIHHGSQPGQNGFSPSGTQTGAAFHLFRGPACLTGQMEVGPVNPPWGPESFPEVLIRGM